MEILSVIRTRTRTRTRPSFRLPARAEDRFACKSTCKSKRYDVLMIIMVGRGLRPRRAPAMIEKMARQGKGSRDSLMAGTFLEGFMANWVRKRNVILPRLLRCLECT